MFHMILTRLFRAVFISERRRSTATALVAVFLVLSLSTAGFYFLESGQKLSLFDSLWLSYVTMTTVGYGDISPATTAGRIFCVVVTMTGGIGVAAYMVTLLATVFIERESKKLRGQARVDFTGHILIVNCPNEEKVLSIIEEIRMDKKTSDVPIVLISDTLQECPSQFLELNGFAFVRGNPLLARVLEQANAAEAASAIILARDSSHATSDGLTTQLALTLENMHRTGSKDIYTVAEAVARDSIGPLKAAGVEEVICLETLVSPIIVQGLLDPGVSEVISELASNRKGSQYYVGQVSFLKGRKYSDITGFLLKQPSLRVIPLAISRDGKPIINPVGETELLDGDKLLYIADERRDLREVFAGL